MALLSDLMKRFNQSEFGRALSDTANVVSGVGGNLLNAARNSNLVTSFIGEPLTPDAIAAHQRALNEPGLALEERLKLSEVKPSRVQQFFGQPLRQLLNLPEIPRKDVPGNAEFRERTGQDLFGQRMADWMTEVGNTFPAVGDVAQIGGQAMIPFGVKPFRGTSSEAILSARKPSEAFAARMGRVEKRAGKPTGQPKNEPVVALDKKGNAVPLGTAGADPVNTMLRMRQQLGDDATIWDHALWYDKMAKAIADHFDVEAADAYKLAFAVTQAANSPVAGIRDVLIGERLAAEHPEPSAPAVNAGALRALFSGEAPVSGIGQKISEFIDNLFGKRTRTQMNDEPRYGAPATADRHDFRAQGYVDYAYREWLRRNLADPELIDRIKLDGPDNPKGSGRVSEAQFENLVKNRNAQVKAFNESKFAGHDDWTPERIQAADWAAIKMQQGDAPMAIQDMFAEYFSKAPLELAWGDNSPYSTFYPDLHQLSWEKNAAITNHVLTRLGATVGERLGVRVIKVEPTAGTFPAKHGTYINPNAEFTIFGTAKARQEWIEAMSHAANQTAGLAYHLLPGGQGDVGVFDLMANSPLAQSKMADRAFMSDFLAALRKENPRFEGAEIVSVGGRPTVRIVKVDGEYKIPIDQKTGQAAGHFTPQELADLDAAVQRVTQTIDGFDTQSKLHGAEINSSYNDWGVNKNGEAHTSNFVAEGRQGVVSWLEGPLREQTGKWIEEGFRQHAPDTWDAHFGSARKGPAKPGGAGSSGGSGSIYQPKQLGNFSSAETVSRGWIMPDGVFVQVPPGATHETSLAMATGAPLEQVTAQYPAYAAKGNLIRIVGQMGRSGYRLVAEIYKAPTNAQLRALTEWHKAQSSNPLYDDFYFHLTDPLTQQTIHSGIGSKNIKGAVEATNFDIPF